MPTHHRYWLGIAFTISVLAFFTISTFSTAQAGSTAPQSSSTGDCTGRSFKTIHDSISTPACAPAVTDTPILTLTPTPLPGCYNNERIMLIHDNSGANNLRTGLLARPGVATVDLFDDSSGTPTLAQLQNYDVVMVVGGFSTTANSTAMGNVLASYQDGGGVVVVSGGAWRTAQQIAGRWISGGYAPYNQSLNFASGGPFALGSYDASNPLMNSVTTLSTSEYISTTLASGATHIASLANSNELLAAKARAVGITAFLNDGNWSGDYPRIIVNAGRYLSNFCGTPFLTSTPTSTVTSTSTPTPNSTPTGTGTAVAPTSTSTPSVPTGTPTSAATTTPAPTDTPTNTATGTVIATTSTPAATNTPTNTPTGATSTPAPPTDTPIVTGTPAPPTNTPVATGTPPPSDTPLRATNTPATTPAPPTLTPSATVTDCPNAFVDITGNVFYAAIHYLNCAGAVSGGDATHYNPGGTSTRAQFAKVVVIAFGLPSQTPTSGPTFSDVPPTYFAYVYIESGYAQGILSGFDAATCQQAGRPYPCYLPNREITRGQLTKLVVNAAHYPLYTPGSGQQDFTDVPPANVFFAAIETAHNKGVINGYPDSTFRPNNNIRRDEMAHIVFKGVTTP